MNTVTLSVEVPRKGTYGYHRHPEYPDDTVLVKLQVGDNAKLDKGHYLVTGYVSGGMVKKNKKGEELAITEITTQTVTPVPAETVVNTMMYSGRLGGDPRQPESKKATYINVATGSNENVVWMNATAFGTNAENLAKYFAKGNGIVMSGALKPADSYNGKATPKMVIWRWEFGSNNAARSQAKPVDIQDLSWIVEGEDAEVEQEESVEAPY